jgi:L-amino acid N-acyltransferase YncA
MNFKNNMEITFRPMTSDDWLSVAEIYRQGIETGHATFQHEIPTWENWDKGHLKSCRIVAVFENEIVGWVGLSAVSSRCVYAGVSEVSVYVGKKYRGQKLGRKLLEALITESEKDNIWTLQAGIFSDNPASLKIHEDLGFRLVGYREKIAKLNGILKDTMLLERRSKIVGID